MDQDYRELCAAQFAHDSRISEAASALVLARTGVILSDEAIMILADNLSMVADEHALTPEELQAALIHNEPQLRAGTLDF